MATNILKDGVLLAGEFDFVDMGIEPVLATGETSPYRIAAGKRTCPKMRRFVMRENTLVVSEDWAGTHRPIKVA